MKELVRYICILRAINVGGNRVVLMEDLKKLLEGIGFENVKTYIQSGNVVFDADMKINNNNIAPMVHDAITKKYGFDVPVIVRQARQFKKALEKNPFLKDKKVDETKLYVTYLAEYPLSANKEEMLNLDFGDDKFEIVGRSVFVKYKTKFSDSRLTNKVIENILKVPCTMRNWKTSMALAELAAKD